MAPSNIIICKCSAWNRIPASSKHPSQGGMPQLRKPNHFGGRQQFRPESSERRENYISKCSKPLNFTQHCQAIAPSAFGGTASRSRTGSKRNCDTNLCRDWGHCLVYTFYPRSRSSPTAQRPITPIVPAAPPGSNASICAAANPHTTARASNNRGATSPRRKGTNNPRSRKQNCAVLSCARLSRKSADA